MIETVVDDELGSSWEYVGDNTQPTSVDEVTADSPGDGLTVGVHDSGAAIHTGTVRGRIIVNVTQPVESDGLRAYPVTHTEAFDEEQYAAGFVRTVGDEIDDSVETFEALAMVAHSGTVDSIDTENLFAHNESAFIVDGDDDTPNDTLVDVFAVKPCALPEDISAEGLKDHRTELVKFVYGIDQDSPEALVELGSEQQPHAETPIEVFTVTALGSVEPLDSD